MAPAAPVKRRHATAKALTPRTSGTSLTPVGGAAQGPLGDHGKTLGLRQGNGFYEKPIVFLDHVVGEGFVREQHRAMLQDGESPATLLDALDAWQPVALPKWAGQKPG